ncbi:nose resistant to fluoxetine protein 6-like [Branchiostoma floridae x Branchiostoma japonicum]
MRLLLYIFLCSTVVILARSQAVWNQGVPDSTAQLNLLQSFLTFGSKVHFQQKLADTGTIRDVSTVNWTDVSIPAQPTANISQQCQKDVAQYNTDLSQGKMYALKMLDAGGKPPSGILSGNLIWAGSYSQCVNITTKGFNITFDGKFYMATLSGSGMAGVTELKIGVCVPSSCSQHDVIRTLDGGMYWHFLVQQGMLQVTSTYSQESLPIQNVTIAAICICGVLLLLLAIGTVYDVIIHQPRQIPTKKQKEIELQEPGVTLTSPDERTQPLDQPPSKKISASKEGIATRILLCFSLSTNTGKVLSTKQAPGSIKSLHGIRFFSLSWIILAHTYMFAKLSPEFDNPLQVSEVMQTFTFQAVSNSFVAVDSFFFLSGLLMSYLLIKQMENSKENGKSVSFGMVYFHRYWRLTPVYLFSMMLYIWVLPYMFSGPFWPPAPDGLDPLENCADNWWTNLLYINNFVGINGDRNCMGWTWYVANDMQFFVIGVPLVYILYRWQILGIAVQLAVLLASFITTAVLTWHYDMKAPDGDFVTYYGKPYCRIGPYLVGVAVGWLLVKMKRKQTRSITMSLLMTVGWLVAAASAVAVLYATYGIYNGTTLQTQGENVLYLTVHRTVWAMALGWVVVACHHGYGGVVDTILSWHGWVPLSRLNYCAYMLHQQLVLVVYLSMEGPIHFSNFTMVYFFLGHLTLSFGLAFLTCVAVETPFVGLEKIILNK